MSMTLLQLIDQVCGELGLAQPASVVGNTNNQTMQLLALFNRLGKDLIREYEWSALVKTYVFTTSTPISLTGNLIAADAGVFTADTSTIAVGDVISGTGVAPYSQISVINGSTVFTMDMPAITTGTGVTLTFTKQYYSLPTDYDRQVSDTFWDRTNHWRNLGAKSSQAMATLRGGVISVGPRERFRIYNRQIQYFPAPPASLNQSLDYVSKYWLNSGTTDDPQSDSYYNCFPDDLMLAGLKYYFLKAKKLDYGPELAEYSDILSTCKAQDQPLPTLSTAPIEYPMLVGPWSIQDGSWPTT